MNNLILENGSWQRKHRQHLNELLASSNGILRVASAYVTDREFLIGPTQRERRLLISLLPLDVASGATSIEALGALIKSGVHCRRLPERPRFHAKVYLFGNSQAVITSANLTGSAFDSNIEVGVEVNTEQTNQLVIWFDELWRKAIPLTLDYLSDLQNKTNALRDEFIKFKRKLKLRSQIPTSEKPAVGFSDTVMHLFENSKRFFVCNTDRRQGERTATGGYKLEQEMFNRGFAAAWEKFNYPDHMEQVEHGDTIFMFAKKVGIMGIGVAKGQCEKLAPGNSNRIRNVVPTDNKTTEWRVPVEWLTEWTDEAGAYKCKAPRPWAFYDVTESKYESFREAIKVHFVGDI